MVVGLWGANSSIQSGSGSLGSRTILYSQVMGLWVAESGNWSVGSRTVAYCLVVGLCVAEL